MFPYNYNIHLQRGTKGQMLLCLPRWGVLGIFYLNFRWRRWGFSLPGLRTLDPPLSSKSTPAEIFQPTCLEGKKEKTVNSGHAHASHSDKWVLYLNFLLWETICPWHIGSNVNLYPNLVNLLRFQSHVSFFLEVSVNAGKARNIWIGQALSWSSRFWRIWLNMLFDTKFT